jgi:hypothetical protein
MESRLTLIKEVLKKNGKRQGLYRCICGKEKELRIYMVEQGLIRSCGCLQRETASSIFSTHGMSKTSVYKIWKSIIQRTTNPKCVSYKNYGGRGIGIEDSWLEFNSFYSDMGDRPTKKHSIERLDNNKGYSKSNCVWATSIQQANNKRNNRLLILNGRTQNVQQWAIELGISAKVLRKRLSLKWSDEKTLTTKIRKRAIINSL